MRIKFQIQKTVILFSDGVQTRVQVKSTHSEIRKALCMVHESLNTGDIT